MPSALALKKISFSNVWKNIHKPEREREEKYRWGRQQQQRCNFFKVALNYTSAALCSRYTLRAQIHISAIIINFFLIFAHEKILFFRFLQVQTEHENCTPENFLLCEFVLLILINDSKKCCVRVRERRTTMMMMI